MADKSKIDWTEATWNPVTGCSKVSKGCRHCYAEREWPRLAGNPKSIYYGRKFTDVQFHPERLDQPYKWAKARMIFVNSMSDLFHPEVPFEFIKEVFKVIKYSPQHTFQVLTKRLDRLLEPQFWEDGDPPNGDYSSGVEPMYKLLPWPKNLWLGVTAENQEQADKRIPILLQIPAAIRFVSVEPMLGPVDLTRIGGDQFGWGRIDALNGLRYIRANATESGCEWETTSHGKIDWVICGGELGPKARPMHLDWVLGLKEQCQATGVPYFFKQWGEYSTYYDGKATYKNVYSGAGVDEPYPMYRVGKKAAGRLLDGRTWDEMPRLTFHY